MRVKYLLVIVLFPFYSCISSEKPQIEREEMQILPGAYNLEQYMPLISGKTIGVVANKASLINGTHLVDTLLSIKTDIKINTIFSPEHGFSGTFDAGKSVEGEQFGKEEIKIISLYGNKKKPDVEDLKGIEAIIFDLQDVGVRFYTYISTLHYVMQACAENNISLVVLDRPNPHCNYIDGPVLEDKYKSFVGMHPVPVVYGMTIGEYAQMINGEGWLGDNLKCDLRIVTISNFKRDSFYEFTQKPSPNLPNMRAIYLYPSLCFFEGTVMSVGRGTDFPFQVFGHPIYADASFSFKPKSIPGASLYPKWQGETCFGQDLRNVSIDSLRAMKSLNLSFLFEAYSSLETNKDFFNNYFDNLAGTEKLRSDILQGKTVEEIRSYWKDDLIEFEKIRNKYLLYK
jgi:uncharacterized protein YbbC (DUF1343 family)